jgi:hypothetical protein
METSLTPQKGSSNALEPLTKTSGTPPTLAAERARLLFGCYRKADANDPETYTAAIAAILAEYSPEVVQRVTDPRTGIARKIKFLPTVAEMSEECEAAKKYLADIAFLEGRGYRFENGKIVRPSGEQAA